jgi:predicted alpha/beta hydrolase family esterase
MVPSPSILVMLDNAGHINADAGFYRWDAGLALVNTLI